MNKIFAVPVTWVIVVMLKLQYFKCLEFELLGNVREIDKIGSHNSDKPFQEVNNIKIPCEIVECIPTHIHF